jgi:hypothetical protein
MTNQTKNKLAPWQLLLIGSLSTAIISGILAISKIEISILSSVVYPAFLTN